MCNDFFPLLPLHQVVKLWLKTIWGTLTKKPPALTRTP